MVPLMVVERVVTLKLMLTQVEANYLRERVREMDKEGLSYRDRPSMQKVVYQLIAEAIERAGV